VIDRLTPERRSALMRNVKSRDTTPERTVRSLLHRLGYRFRLQKKDLPGTPDIVLPRHRSVVLVNGCYWHGHSCRNGRLPKSRLDFWGPKIRANRQRDRRNLRDLSTAGWRVLVIWQCEVKQEKALRKRLLAFLREKCRSTI
jgi:DNA mismatch endonuclease, patch repair protein